MKLVILNNNNNFNIHGVLGFWGKRGKYTDTELDMIKKLKDKGESWSSIGNLLNRKPTNVLLIFSYHQDRIQDSGPME